MFLIVGLGNPGREYEKTRHNAGFTAVDFIADFYGISLQDAKCNSIIGCGKIGGQDVILAKPMTYMNRSGIAVKCLAIEYSLEADRIIVIYDDIDLPLGRIRIREKGSSGGHRGIASIIKELGTNEFIRVRIGIGRPESPKVDIVEHVLSPFLPEEEADFDSVLRVVRDAVETIILHGVSKAMSIFNSGK